MLGLFVLLLVGLQLKHFVADYLLQPVWILEGKGDLSRPGGYAHAGIHAGLSALVLLVGGTPFNLLLGLAVAEFAIHYLLDYGKIRYSAGVHIENAPSRFWALHGLDQLLHQLSYAAMIYVVLLANGAQ